MPQERPETLIPPLGVVLSGYFVSKERYCGWRKHGTKDWQILYTVGGHGLFATSKGDLITGSGDAVILQPGVPHDYGAPPDARQPWSVRWVHFLPQESWLPWLRWPEHAPGVLRLRLQTPELRAMVLNRFSALIRFSGSPLRHAETLAKTILQEIILHCDTCNPRLNEPLLDPRIRRAVDLLSKNLSTRWELPQLADYCGLSVSRFSHLFHRETGKSPGHYHEDLRMYQAMQSLRHTDRRISEISALLGYDDPLYFSNRFRRYTGLSPRAFRAREK